MNARANWVWGSCDMTTDNQRIDTSELDRNMDRVIRVSVQLRH